MIAAGAMKSHGAKIVAAHVTPSFRLDNTRLAGRALRIHVILGD